MAEALREVGLCKRELWSEPGCGEKFLPTSSPGGYGQRGALAVEDGRRGVSLPLTHCVAHILPGKSHLCWVPGTELSSPLR